MSLYSWRLSWTRYPFPVVEISSLSNIIHISVPKYFLPETCVMLTFQNWFVHVFDFPNNFLLLTLSSRTSPFRKRLSFFWCGLIANGVCIFMWSRHVTHTRDVFQQHIDTFLLLNSCLSSLLCNSLESKTSNSSLIGSSISPYTIKQSQNKIKEATNSNDLSGNMRFKLSISDWYISILFSAHSVGSLYM